MQGYAGTRGSHIYSDRVHAKLAKVSKCRLCFGTGLRQFRYTHEASISSLGRLNGTVLCVCRRVCECMRAPVYMCVQGCRKFRANSRETRKQQENETTAGDEIFSSAPTGIQRRFAVDDAEEIREGNASR